MWGAFVGFIADIIRLFEGVIGNWGLAIILFTVAIKVVTWPLTGKQLKSSRAMQELQPKIKALQTKYKDDKEAQTREMMALYQEAGVNPAMGCLPMLIQMPIWFGLYRAILVLAESNELVDGFLFVPSLALPDATMGFQWIFDFAALPQNWGYLILPILTVITQIMISRIMTPTTAGGGDGKGGSDPTQAMMKQMTTVMPVMFGAFALTLPAGLALYWVTNNVLTGAQYFLLNRTKDSEVALSTSPALASVGADGAQVIEVEATPKKKPRSKDRAHGKSRRSRKKR